MDRTGTRRLLNIAAALLLAQTAATSIQNFMVIRRTPLGFDDAYMFLRYAHNIRHGFGFSWNLNGVHTYGPTSLLWSFFTLLFSYLPTDPWTQLILGSWLFSFAAVIAIAWAVAANAQSDWLRSPLRVLPLIAVPLFASTALSGQSVQRHGNHARHNPLRSLPRTLPSLARRSRPHRSCLWRRLSFLPRAPRVRNRHPAASPSSSAFFPATLGRRSDPCSCSMPPSMPASSSNSFSAASTSEPRSPSASI